MNITPLHIYFLYLCSDRHIEFTCNLAILSICKNLECQVAMCLTELDAFGYIPKSGISRSYDSSLGNFDF